MQQPVIHVVWFKRDLRIQDHAALYEASRLGKVLPVFTWDATVWSGADYSAQHVAFVRECLDSLKRDLQQIGLDLYETTHGIIDVLNVLSVFHQIGGLFSHEETGNQRTYALDIEVKKWCQAHAVSWHEYPQNGVVRRLKNRNHWNAHWRQRMSEPVYAVPQAHLAEVAWVSSGLTFQPDAAQLQKPQQDKPGRQKGGRQQALKMLHSFLNGRASQYRGGISSPISSVSAGSRISPYLAWGVLSMKEVVHALRRQQAEISLNPHKYPPRLAAGLAGFESRLHWHCHFMQKLESEPELEYQNLHVAFNGIRDESCSDAQSQERLTRWAQGKTGWPLVDACMAMLRETGWINFRMRAMLMSTASYLYWLHWRETGLHLAREFLDYEPGIHWPQVQMQSGTTGINTLRIYNPIKQAKDQDPQGVFVRRWIPALKNVPTGWIFEPWLMTPELQHQYQCVIGVDYPAPLLTIESALKQARAMMAQAKYGADHACETRRVVEKHASRKDRTAKMSRALKAIKSSDEISNIGLQQSLF